MDENELHIELSRRPLPLVAATFLVLISLLWGVVLVGAILSLAGCGGPPPAPALLVLVPLALRRAGA